MFQSLYGASITEIMSPSNAMNVFWSCKGTKCRRKRPASSRVGDFAERTDLAYVWRKENYWRTIRQSANTIVHQLGNYIYNFPKLEYPWSSCDAYDVGGRRKREREEDFFRCSSKFSHLEGEPSLGIALHDCQEVPPGTTTASPRIGTLSDVQRTPA